MFQLVVFEDTEAHAGVAESSWLKENAMKTFTSHHARERRRRGCVVDSGVAGNVVGVDPAGWDANEPTLAGGSMSLSTGGIHRASFPLVWELGA
jgi:hypothetical protein